MYQMNLFHFLFLAGHSDYAYQQSSYTEQSYDRSFEDSTQHYYEGGEKIYWQSVQTKDFAHICTLHLGKCKSCFM